MVSSKPRGSFKGSHSVFSCPLFGSDLILWLVGLVDMGDFWGQRIIWIWIRQEGGNGERHLGNGKGWGPLILQDIKADGSVGVDVWMVDPGGEVDPRWLEWIVIWEVDVQEVDPSSER